MLGGWVAGMISELLLVCQLAGFAACDPVHLVWVRVGAEWHMAHGTWHVACGWPRPPGSGLRREN